MVGQTAGLGLGLSLAVALVFRLAFGPQGMVAGLVFGLLAAGLQTVAVVLAAPKIAAGDYAGLLSKWAVGAMIRLAGVVLIPVAVMIDRNMFPPLAAGLGYLAVLVPLFFFEIRRFR